MTQSKAPRPKRRLGRGLDSLVSSPVNIDMTETAEDGLRLVSVEAVRPNARQPRQSFDEATLHRLAESIRTAGVMQPVVVRPAETGYQLIAGERRWRAARLAGLTEIPAVVRSVTDQEAAEFALIENIQREDLNPIERAEAFARLAGDFGMTHQQIADRVGLERSNVTSHLRLLELEEDLKEAVRSRRLSMGHARALLAITNSDERRALAGQVIAAGWSVREVERRVRKMVQATRADDRGTTKSEPAAQLHMQDLERRLGSHLGTKVEIRPGRAKGSGQLIISFFTFDEFEGLLQRLNFDIASDR
jgi:ParB family transcriptional regulator, chromosome partitioning protein